MSKYGVIATNAVKLVTTGTVPDPRRAWVRAAVRQFPDSLTSQAKNCPRDSFLGLCEGGFITGVAPGHYTRSMKNKRYVTRALRALRANPDLLADQRALWRIACGDSTKHHNSQMDVLIALWVGGLITIT